MGDPKSNPGGVSDPIDGRPVGPEHASSNSHRAEGWSILLYTRRPSALPATSGSANDDGWERR